MDIKKPGMLKQIKNMGKDNNPDSAGPKADEADLDESERPTVAGKPNLLNQNLAEVERIMNIAKPEFNAVAEHQKRAEESKTKTKSGDTKGTAARKAKRREEEDKAQPTKPKAKVKISELMAKKNYEEEQEKARQKREINKKTEKMREEQKKKQNKIYLGTDRLLEDKLYLSILAEGGIGFRSDVADDTVNGDVAYEAQEALEFLDAREKFWDQIELGSDHSKKRPGKPTKALESFRWLM